MKGSDTDPGGAVDAGGRSRSDDAGGRSRTDYAGGRSRSDYAGEAADAGGRSQSDHAGEAVDATGRSRSDYAGLVSRLVALGVDGAVLGAAVPLVGAGGPALWNTLTGHTPDWVRVCASVAAGAVPVLYFWLGWWVIGRSLGGLLLGYTVRRRDGAQLRMLRAAVRSFVGLLLAPLWLAGMLLVLWDPRRRALHDVLLGTIAPRSFQDPVAAADAAAAHHPIPAHHPVSPHHPVPEHHPVPPHHSPDADHAADPGGPGNPFKEARP